MFNDNNDVSRSSHSIKISFGLIIGARGRTVIVTEQLAGRIGIPNHQQGVIEATAVA
jgi:hypothetical protein